MPLPIFANHSYSQSSYIFNYGSFLNDPKYLTIIVFATFNGNTDQLHITGYQSKPLSFMLILQGWLWRYKIFKVAKFCGRRREIFDWNRKYANTCLIFQLSWITGCGLISYYLFWNVAAIFQNGRIPSVQEFQFRLRLR